MFLSSCQIFSGSAVFVIFFLFNQFKQDSDEINKCINNTISYEDTDFNSTSDRFLKVVRANTERVGDLSLTNDEDNYSIVVPTIWNLIWIIFLLGIIGLVIFIFSFFAIKTIKEVILAGAMRFYWLLIWMIPVEIFFIVSLFDWRTFTKTLAVHWWAKPSFSLIRNFTCERESCEDFLDGISTAETKCKVPVFQNPAEMELELNIWCLERYKSNNCYDILENAQNSFLNIANIFFGVNIGIGVFLLILLYLTMRSLTEVISKPIVQRSQAANIPAWLSVPIVGSVYMHFLLQPQNSVSVEYSRWIAILYLVSAGTFSIAALLSWHIAATSVMNRADKKRKQISVILFIFAMELTIVVLVSIFVTSVVMLVSFTQKSISDKEWYGSACKLDRNLNNCATCTDPNNQECPQWSKKTGIRHTLFYFEAECYNGLHFPHVFFPWCWLWNCAERSCCNVPDRLCLGSICVHALCGF
mmetsp:Transcript_2288/g.4900  ORF Transcript_2288/g.4900 Transcript_2288/m.4900 type:complete len:471 (-) Transcript_2288:432-1844(-)